MSFLLKNILARQGILAETSLVLVDSHPEIQIVEMGNLCSDVSFHKYTKTDAENAKKEKKKKIKEGEKYTLERWDAQFLEGLYKLLRYEKL